MIMIIYKFDDDSVMVKINSDQIPVSNRISNGFRPSYYVLFTSVLKLNYKINICL